MSGSSTHSSAGGHRPQVTGTRGGGLTVEGALHAVEDVEGWLSEAQARLLFERARELPPGARAVEIGSYRGRSAIVLALGAGPEVGIVAVDPHAGNDRGPREIHGVRERGDADNRAFAANLERAGVSERVEHVRLPSAEALASVGGPIDLLYVDGAHRYAPARDDIRDWGARVGGRGALLIHDSFSSVGVTLALLRLLAASPRFEYLGRTGSLAEYRRRDVHGRARARSFAAQLAELPWFARNLAIKVGLVLRLPLVGRLLGHRSRDWPY